MVKNIGRGYFAVALHNPKTDANVGSALRACTNFGASMLVTSGRRYKNAATNTTRAERFIPLFIGADVFDFIPRGCVPVAVEITDGARSLPTYVHPEQAFYIFGPEDGSLPRAITERCRDVISIPTNQCMNLAVTVGVVLYDRCSKRGEWS